MAYELSTLKRGRYLVESTFGVSQSAQPAYNDFPFQAADVTLATEMLPVQILQQRKDGVELAEVGRTRPTVALKSHLYGAGLPISASTSPPTNHLANILSTIMGGLYSAAGSGILSGNSASFVMDTSTGTRFKTGQPIVALDTNTGKYRARLIRSMSADTVYLANALPVSPVSGAQALNGYHCHFREDASGSLQFQLQGANSSNQWCATGLQGSFTLENVLGQLPMISFALNGANWISQSVGSSLSRVDYASTTPTAPPAFIDSEVLFYRRDSVTTCYTGSNVPMAGVSIAPTVAYLPVESAGGVNNLERWVRGPATVTAEVTPYLNDRQYTEARANKYEYALQVTIGSSPGRMVVLTVPRVQLMDVGLADNNGIGGYKVALSALKNNLSDSVVSSGYEDLAQSLMVVSFF